MVSLCLTQLVPAGMGLVTGETAPTVKDRVAHSPNVA